MSKKKKIIGVVCGVVAVAVVGGYLLLNQNSGAAVMVSTETLQQMDLQNTVSLTGVVESETDRKVYSTLSYLVESVNVQVGDVVQAGDVLAQLDTEQLEMDIAQQRLRSTARRMKTRWKTMRTVWTPTPSRRSRGSTRPKAA